MVSVMLYPCMFCFALSMDPFVLCIACLTVFVNCLLKQFAICLGVFVILLLNVMELLKVWLEVLHWINHVWYTGILLQGISSLSYSVLVNIFQ